MDEQTKLDSNSQAFERELTQAMRRVEAPASLEAFLLAATERERTVERHNEGRMLRFKPRTQRRAWSLPWMSHWAGGAVAALLVLGSIGSVEAIHLQNVRRQEEATRQFAAAEQIRNRALEQARQQIERAGVSLGD